jgi:hypothetical protein
MSSLLPDEAKIDLALRERGILHSLREIQYDGSLCVERAPDLLELLKLPYSIYVRSALAEAFFARPSNKEHIREAINTILEIIKANPERYDALSNLVLNEFASNVSPSSVTEVGTLVLDPKYGPMRLGFVEALKQIGTPEAVRYLRRIAGEPTLASYALAALARLDPGHTVVLCEQALRGSKVKYKEAIRNTYTKLKRRMVKARDVSAHLTQLPIPSGLPEFSINLDRPELIRGLRLLGRCIGGDCGRSISAEIRAVVDTLAVNETLRSRFRTTSGIVSSDLWVQVLCDDEDAYCLYVFASEVLVNRLQEAFLDSQNE